MENVSVPLNVETSNEFVRDWGYEDIRNDYENDDEGIEGDNDVNDKSVVDEGEVGKGGWCFLSSMFTMVRVRVGGCFQVQTL